MKQDVKRIVGDTISFTIMLLGLVLIMLTIAVDAPPTLTIIALTWKPYWYSQVAGFSLVLGCILLAFLYVTHPIWRRMSVIIQEFLQ